MQCEKAGPGADGSGSELAGSAQPLSRLACGVPGGGAERASAVDSITSR